MKINIKILYKLVVSILLVIARHAQIIQNMKFAISWQYLKKEGRDEVDFFMQINIKLYCNLILIIFVGITRPAQITQNNKFVKSLKYFKKELRDEVVSLCRWASQFSLNWYYYFSWVRLGMPKALKIKSKCTVSLQYLKKELMKLMFCMLINMKVFYKLIVLFLKGLMRHVQSTRLNLQCLCDILRKKSGIKLGA